MNTLNLLTICAFCALSFSGTGPLLTERPEQQAACKAYLYSEIAAYEGECKDGLAHGTGSTTGEEYYEGSFKKGKPHGQGTLFYKNGDSFKGYWRKGLKNGKGQFFMKREGRADSVLAGYWTDDKYVGDGPQKTPFRVLQQLNVNRSRSEMIDEIDQQVELRIQRTGRPLEVTNLIFRGSSGISYQRGNGQGLTSVEFPFTANVSMFAVTITGNSFAPIEFSFEITKPGNWIVYLEV